ncbi:hypothetical protein GCM10010985_32900 [Caballeronia grimmiae]|uniref:Uncharacterized protein n=1 Tax=Caballeronia grimmiae TaxID=1071679 RepID=A0ABQ1RMV6_9BURK|nr:hypothetical protein GCM10010985_32900 [Caballeronia grimmiae]
MTQKEFCCDERCGSKQAGSVVTPQVRSPPATGCFAAALVAVADSDLLQAVIAALSAIVMDMVKARASAG